MTQLVTYDCTDGIAILTLNRADKRNALSLALWQELEGHLDTIEAAGGPSAWSCCARQGRSSARAMT